MHAQIGWAGFVERLKNEAPRYVQLLPELPRLLHQALALPHARDQQRLLEAMLLEQRQTNRLLRGGACVVLGVLLGLLGAQLLMR